MLIALGSVARPDASDAPRWPRAGIGLAAALAYYAGAQLGFFLRFPSSGISFLWPPTAILTAILLCIPSRSWPAAAAGAFAAHAVAHSVDGVPAAIWVVQFAANVVQALLGAGIVRALHPGPLTFSDLRSVSAFVFGVVIVAPAIASTIAAHAYVTMGWASTFGTAWRTRELSNVLAALTFTPPLIVAINTIRASPGRVTVWRVPALSGVLLVVGVVSAEYALDPARAAVSLTAEEKLTILQVIIAAAAIPLMLLAALVEQSRSEHRRLQVSQRRYALATAASRVGVWEWDAGAWYVDPRLSATLGYRPDPHEDLEIWRSRVHPADRDSVERAAAVFIGKDDPFFEIEGRVLDRAGDARWLRIRGAATRTSEGRVRHMIGTYIDTTDVRTAMDALLESQERSRELAGRLLSVQEEERARIARNLHDNASQGLASLAIRLAVFRRGAGVHSAAEHRELTELHDSAIAIGEQIRHFAHELHPAILQRAGLGAAVDAICDRAEADYQLRVERTFALTSPVPMSVALCLYRVCQEALLNVAKHAEASRVTVHLSSTAESVRLLVSDDGRGFDQSIEPASGIGLTSLDERLRLLQGTLTVTTHPGGGTLIVATVPALEA